MVDMNEGEMENNSMDGMETEMNKEGMSNDMNDSGEEMNNDDMGAEMNNDEKKEGEDMGSDE